MLLKKRWTALGTKSTQPTNLQYQKVSYDTGSHQRKAILSLKYLLSTFAIMPSNTIQALFSKITSI